MFFRILRLSKKMPVEIITNQITYPTKKSKWNSIIFIKWEHQWIFLTNLKNWQATNSFSSIFPYLIIKMWLWQCERASNIEMISSSFSFQFCSSSKIFSTYFQNISYQFCITFVLITTSISRKFHDCWKSRKAD